MKHKPDTNGKLNFKSSIGDATNNQKKREKWYKTKVVDYSKCIRTDESDKYGVRTIVWKKI